MLQTVRDSAVSDHEGATTGAKIAMRIMRMISGAEEGRSLF